MSQTPKSSPSRHFLITLTETDEGLTINGYHVGEEHGLAYVIGHDIMLQIERDLSCDNLKLKPIFRAETIH